MCYACCCLTELSSFYNLELVIAIVEEVCHFHHAILLFQILLVHMQVERFKYMEAQKSQQQMLQNLSLKKQRE